MIKKLTTFILVFCVFLGFSGFDVRANEIPSTIEEVFNITIDEDTPLNTIMIASKEKKVNEYVISSEGYIEGYIWVADISINAEYIYDGEVIKIVSVWSDVLDRAPSSNFRIIDVFYDWDNTPKAIVTSHCAYTNSKGINIGTFCNLYISAIQN